MKKLPIFQQNSKRSKKADNEPTENAEKYLNIADDPDYQRAVIEFQQGHWNSCVGLLNQLRKKYPEDETLDQFMRDLEFQYSVIKNVEKSAADQKKTAQIHGLKELLLVAGVGLIALVLVVGVVLLFDVNISKSRQVSQANQITTYATQAESLLNSGQPEKAAGIVKLMQAIDPNNATVVDLSAKTDEVLKLQDRYDEASNAISNEQYADALVQLKNIEAESPNYRDVPHLINNVETIIQVNQANLDGRDAYENGAWQSAIDNLESIQRLSPGEFTEELKVMLLNSYMQRIIELLQNNSPTFDEIDQAETYYRRASAMIPQSKIYSGQREDLQKISSDLLILNLTNSAGMIVENPHQTLTTVNLALGYLKEAASLDPTNVTIASELNKMNLYLSGYQSYLGMNWSQAIEQLSVLVNMDDHYANGFAKQMLCEAYITRGNQFINSGYYDDARKQFEFAEMLTWNETNLTNFYLVEIDLAEVLVKLGDYQNAASYYKYAIEKVNYRQRASVHSEFVSSLMSAVNLYSNGQYRESVNLFQETLKDQEYLFTTIKVSAQKEDTIAMIATQYHSSVSSILAENNLPNPLLMTTSQEIVIPTLAE